MGQTDTRTRIIDSALDLFSKQGYDSTTTRSIAERSGVNELTLFRNFGSKENLLSEVIDHHFNEVLYNGSVDFEPTGNPDEDLFRIVSGIRAILWEEEDLYRLMLREVARNEIVASKLGKFPVMMKGLMLSRFRDAIGGKMDERFDLETAGIFLASYFIRSEMMRIMLGKDPFQDIDESRSREVIDIFLNGVLKEGPD